MKFVCHSVLKKVVWKNQVTQKSELLLEEAIKNGTTKIDRSIKATFFKCDFEEWLFSNAILKSLKND